MYTAIIILLLVLQSKFDNVLQSHQLGGELSANLQ